MNDLDHRIENEKKHAKYLVEKDAEDVWNWSSPAGRSRAERRGRLIAERLVGCERALEIGCGTGMFSMMVAKALEETTVVATELTDDLLEIARVENALPNIEYRTADAHALDFPDESFDGVFGSSVLHHLDVPRALREMRRVLKPGGKLVFAEPNMLNPQIWAERNIDYVRERMGASPDETAFVRVSLKYQLEREGFVAVDIVPHEFLHPAIPGPLVPAAKALTEVLEQLPVVREIGGSLLIYCRK